MRCVSSSENDAAYVCALASGTLEHVGRSPTQTRPEAAENGVRCSKLADEHRSKFTEVSNVPGRSNALTWPKLKTGHVTSAQATLKLPELVNFLTARARALTKRLS